ncbi:hypothetical protein JAAARDRAFT_34485 [Jaapia argillacea MUCL 33604]|uniref:Uncharacterized protein n=1 Tax=Jaapia argillacea MUCL 33604 TaxID=933084 RepID=A0A067PVA5_9AGAM|nr:hypothetical protein JAAARDRAFT_34485 [Jaapia argillacea MUCL 33604]
MNAQTPQQLMKHPKANAIMGGAALAVATGLAYWWGFRDVDKRHPSAVVLGATVQDKAEANKR